MRKSILIVDDNSSNLRFFNDLLVMNKFTTHTAKNAPEALAITQSEALDLIVMDIQLPDVSGVELFRIIRESGHVGDIPVIAVTAFSHDDMRDEIMDAGFDEYIPKPVNVPHFIKTVTRLLAARATA